MHEWYPYATAIIRIIYVAVVMERHFAYMFVFVAIIAPLMPAEGKFIIEIRQTNLKDKLYIPSTQFLVIFCVIIC